MESYKKQLHAFALEIGGRAGHAEFSREFVAGLMACFGWETMPGHLDHELTLGGGETHTAGLWWPERKVLIEVRKPYVMLSMAWPELLKACLAMTTLPRYVVFTNRRELHLYDTKDASREEPLLSIELEALPKYSEALAFLTKGWEPKQGLGPILNVATVSKEVAARVGAFYRSLIQGEVGQEDAVKFTLQCITAMFAEDIGLLPERALTHRLYEAQSGAQSVTEVLGDLFGQMSTPTTDSTRAIRYFNGGLFNDPVILPLTPSQLRALTKAAEADWAHVDPHIFGSVFQSIMSDAERHATGAHYTAREDIMLVVGPTIVEPWRRRIQSAKTLTDLRELRQELGTFRVLDPACGSGNFLYVAYRELYRLETELLSRMRNEFPKSQDKVSWVTLITAQNFHGIDINPFAVELARTTLNIAKKIAFDERRNIILELYGQRELVVDPSLPLDNLNENVVCGDALFMAWPAVDAIVGNPPFLGGQKIRSDIGDSYIYKLQDAFQIGVIDLCGYWFRMAHDHLAPGQRAGLVATSAIRLGKTRRESLDYIVAQGGTISNAVSSMPWRGEAMVNVSIVNWVHGPSEESFYLWMNDEIFETKRISSQLRLQVDVQEASTLHANNRGSCMGVIFAHPGYRVGGDFDSQSDDSPALSPLVTGGDLLRSVLQLEPSYCINLMTCRTEEEAEEYDPKSYFHLKQHVYPIIKQKADAEADKIVRSGKGNSHYIHWLTYWWKPQLGRETFFADEVKDKPRMIVCAIVAARPIFCFISSLFVPTNAMQMFAFDDDYSFGIIQSAYHWEWTKALGGRLKNDIRYTTKVWKTFPWPQAPTEDQVVRIAQAGREVRRVREEVMGENEWSLRQLYQSAEKVGDVHPLNQAQAVLDGAVKEAYGHPGDQGVVEFLLELNGYVAQDEKGGYGVQGPGLPEGFEAEDPRWMSEDCIMPPPRPGLTPQQGGTDDV